MRYVKQQDGSYFIKKDSETPLQTLIELNKYIQLRLQLKKEISRNYKINLALAIQTAKKGRTSQQYQNALNACIQTQQNLTK